MYAERWEKGFQDDCGVDADAFVENALQEIYPHQGPLLDGCCGCTYIHLHTLHKKIPYNFDT